MAHAGQVGGVGRMGANARQVQTGGDGQSSETV